MQEYIEGAPHRIKVGCFAGGAAIVLNGFLSVIDVFDVFDEPIYYVVNAYMVFFGVVTMVTESDPSFIQVHETLTPLQKWMHEWAKGLTMLWGRGLFYVFQGLSVRPG
ncbi:ATP-binding cassette sub-family B member 10 [Durusdinium trenchii]|uniref:Mitochondrial n=1 Tax=Durusdinium trenchii TaxID=1381693 RepID=A0ABP0Q897_9DINO